MTPETVPGIVQEALVWSTPMTVSATILAVTFGLIFTESLHGIQRAKLAMTGAGAMVIFGQIFGFYGPEQSLEAIDWNVVFLLGAMMTVIAIMVPTGGFQAIAYWIARFCKGRPFMLMAFLGATVALISTMLDNVTTVIIFGPLAILICQALQINPVPYLMAMAILANAGGVATLVGDPTALMIGSAAEIDFMTFFSHMGPVILFVWIGALFMLRLVFHKRMSKAPKVQEIAFTDEAVITDRKTWYTSLGILALMVVLFVKHDELHWDAWVVSAFGLTALLMLLHKAEMDHYLRDVELSLLVFFISLFIMIGGVEHSQFLQYVGQHLVPFVKGDPLTACLILIWAAGILSALIDNIPFTAAMIPIIQSLESQGVAVTPLWWALAIGVGLGGNGSHIGATANVFVVTLSERLAKKENKPSLAITPGLWLRKGTPVMISSLTIGSIIMWLFFDYYSTPFK